MNRIRPWIAIAMIRVPTTFVLRYTLRASHLELGGVDLDLGMRVAVRPRGSMTLYQNRRCSMTEYVLGMPSMTWLA